jgi:hypothetical protein
MGVGCGTRTQIEWAPVLGIRLEVVLVQNGTTVKTAGLSPAHSNVVLYI